MTLKRPRKESHLWPDTFLRCANVREWSRPGNIFSLIHLHPGREASTASKKGNMTSILIRVCCAQMSEREADLATSAFWFAFTSGRFGSVLLEKSFPTRPYLVLAVQIGVMQVGWICIVAFPGKFASQDTHMAILQELVWWRQDTSA